MNTKIHNKSSLKEFRKKLRNNSTPAEKLLWKHLQKRNLLNMKFRRQHSVGNYILDFYCTELKLSIELDGADHFTEEGMLADKGRTQFLKQFEIEEIRFENKELFKDIETVLKKITDKIIEIQLPTTPP